MYLFSKLAGLVRRHGRVALCAGALLAAGPAAAIDATHAKSVEATGAKSSVTFAAGRDVRIAVTSTHDVFAAGNTVRSEAGSADHLIAAGETLTVAGTDLRDVIAAGKRIELQTGQTQDDVVAFGENVSARPTFKIGGSAVMMGSNVELQAPVGGDVYAAGQDVRIDSAVTGNVKVEGRHVVIGPNARIAGALAYRADQLEIMPGAVITGPKTVLPPEARHQHVARPKTIAQRIGDWVFGTIAFAVMALGLALLFPGLMAVSGRMVYRNPLIAALVGAVVLVVTPAVALVLLVTLVGAPLSLTVLALFCALVPMALAAGAAGLGFLIRSLTGRGKEKPNLVAQLGWTVVGSVLLCALGEIPIVGGWIVLLACILGAGGVATHLRKRLAAHD
ncbi:MAG: polymer-forming cytoskeletal protein [Proteobacteria bacterium]|nr:polymer-forming cytoskeletal protein [Pseudomonadota bacterium]